MSDKSASNDRPAKPLNPWIQFCNMHLEDNRFICKDSEWLSNKWKRLDPQSRFDLQRKYQQELDAYNEKLEVWLKKNSKPVKRKPNKWVRVATKMYSTDLDSGTFD